MKDSGLRGFAVISSVSFMLGANTVVFIAVGSRARRGLIEMASSCRRWRSPHHLVVAFLPAAACVKRNEIRITT